MEKTKSKLFSLEPVVLSVIAPGLGQISMGNRFLGFSFMSATLGTAVAALYLFARGYLAYMDFAINLDPATDVPQPGEIIPIVDIVILFIISIGVYFGSILHAVLRYRNISNERV